MRHLLKLVGLCCATTLVSGKPIIEYKPMYGSPFERNALHFGHEVGEWPEYGVAIVVAEVIDHQSVEDPATKPTTQPLSNWRTIERGRVQVKIKDVLFGEVPANELDLAYSFQVTDRGDKPGLYIWANGLIQSGKPILMAVMPNCYNTLVEHYPQPKFEEVLLPTDDEVLLPADDEGIESPNPEPFPAPATQPVNWAAVRVETIDDYLLMRTLPLARLAKVFESVGSAGESMKFGELVTSEDRLLRYVGQQRLKVLEARTTPTTQP